jgi:riboflavin synthase
MFTGLVEAVGVVRSSANGTIEIECDAGAWEDPIVVGESVCVNGCCLTATEVSEVLRFELSPETVKRTTLGSLEAGALVNLERAMRPTDRLGGHLVQGHIDGAGTVLLIRRDEESHLFRFEAPPGSDQFLVNKGSVAVDGISLTVDSPAAGAFGAWIVPYTFAHTNLRSLKEGDSVNLEFDLFAKYVQKMLP